MEDSSSQTIKLTFIGDSAVGKTSLLNCWSKSDFTQSDPTIGGFYIMKTMNIEGKDVNFSIWDTAGQEKYRSLTPIYIRFADGIILVVSVIDSLSFANIPTWIEYVSDFFEKIPPMILVINKMDLQESNYIDRKAIYEKYKETFKEIIYTSAVTGQNVPELFEHIGKEAYKFHYPNFSVQKIDITPSLEQPHRCC